MPSKPELRRRSEVRRAERTETDLREAGAAIARHLLSWPVVNEADSIAAYLSMESEPSTWPLVEALHERGMEVLLPVVQPDMNLQWARYEGPHALRISAFGISEPTGELLGLDAVRGIDAIIVPGLAVDLLGHRLGRGAGCYDRALGHVDGSTGRVVVLFDDEIVDTVPHEDHDQRIHNAVTPSGMRPLA